MSLKLNSSGGGSVTLQEPTTASNVTLNLPAATGTVVYSDASGNIPVTGQIRSNASLTPPTFADSTGTQIGTLCRAWGKYNYVGANSSITLGAAFNISSFTRNAAGDYTFAFANAMPDTNYVVTAVPTYTATQSMNASPITKTTGSVRLYLQFTTSTTGAASLYDFGVDFAVFR